MKTGRQALRSGRRRGGREPYRVARDPSGVGGEGGGREAYGVSENSGGDCHGVGGGVEDAFPQGDETNGVETDGNRAKGDDKQGWEGDRNPHTTRAIAESGADGNNDGMARGLRTAPPPRPNRTAEDDNRIGPKTACARAASTDYWRRKIRTGVEPTRVPGQEETSKGPLEGRQRRGGQRR